MKGQGWIKFDSVIVEEARSVEAFPDRVGRENCFASNGSRRAG